MVSPRPALLPLLLLLLLLLEPAGAGAGVPWPQGSPSQLRYLDNELSMFMHYSICTYNDGCDGGQQDCNFEGKEQPWPASSFDPTGLDTEQWAETARDLGANQVCLTVHHTGGFALWPTNSTAYGVKESPFFARTGRDIVAEFVASMRKHGIEPCFYSA
jgi:alpha-L-fucosidase|eukprot:COSAG06_NODE_434_length_15810_cov_9.319521_11_plen_159_part_00